MSIKNYRDSLNRYREQRNIQIIENNINDYFDFFNPKEETYFFKCSILDKNNQILSSEIISSSSKSVDSLDLNKGFKSFFLKTINDLFEEQFISKLNELKLFSNSELNHLCLRNQMSNDLNDFNHEKSSIFVGNLFKIIKYTYSMRKIDKNIIEQLKIIDGYKISISYFNNPILSQIAKDASGEKVQTRTNTFVTKIIEDAAKIFNINIVMANNLIKEKMGFVYRTHGDYYNFAIHNSHKAGIHLNSVVAILQKYSNEKKEHYSVELTTE